MTTFEDGPAKGKTLMLRRAAMFIRVTEASGNIDALDQLEDRAASYETLYAYEIVGTPGHMHMRCGGNRRAASGSYPIATYRLVKDQPSDAVMRDNGEWGKWADTQGKAKTATDPVD